MLESGHSRIPVYDDDLDHIEGIAYSRDILGLLNRDEGPPSTLPHEVVKPAIFIPETKTREELLSEYQERQVHIAIVVDEYGGVSGLVTIEDLLEEIVGEIHDEFDPGDPEIEVVGEGDFLMDAGVGIDQLGELLKVDVEGDGFDTLGGFVYHRLGKIAGVGDVVEYDGLKIEIVSTAGRRLKQLRVTRTSA
jgi:CBS domain containing-hemolysin-like protein